MSQENVEIVQALIPPPDADLASILRDDELFEATIDALASVLDPELESVAVWQGGTTYRGVQGFRDMWLDWLQPYVAYYTQVDEMIDVSDSVVVLVRDRGRLSDTEYEVDLMAQDTSKVPYRLLQLTVMGQGHSYDARIANISLVGD